MEQQVAAGNEQLAREMPFWGDPQQRLAAQQQIVEWATSKGGYTRAELSGLSSPHHLKAMMKAALFDRWVESAKTGAPTQTVAVARGMPRRRRRPSGYGPPRTRLSKRPTSGRAPRCWRRGARRRRTARRASSVTINRREIFTYGDYSGNVPSLDPLKRGTIMRKLLLATAAADRPGRRLGQRHSNNRVRSNFRHQHADGDRQRRRHRHDAQHRHRDLASRNCSGTRPRPASSTSPRPPSTRRKASARLCSSTTRALSRSPRWPAAPEPISSRARFSDAAFGLATGEQLSINVAIAT